MMRRLLLFGMLGATACSAPIQAGSQATRFQCTVTGKPPVQSDACGLVKREIDKTLKKPSTMVQALDKSSASDWMSVSIRLTKNRSAAATMKRKRQGVERAFPEIVIDVMDKPLETRELEMLARQIAAQNKEK